MSDSGSSDTNGTGADGGLRQFEKNRFFNGKLMTARDMRAEQDYHAGRLAALARHVTGEGVVCGLEVSIEQAEGGGDTPTAVVEPGLAFDSRGRPIVVAGDPAREEIPSERMDDGVSVFLEQSTCKTESVPAVGSEDACKEECDYNRLRETADVTFTPGPPATQQKPVPVDRVGFPSREELRFDETEGDGIEPGDDALQDLALSYHLDPEEGGYLSCDDLRRDTAGDARVFLGYFRQREDGSWHPVDDPEVSEPRPHVYTNDMLYAGLTKHALDFENPHDVSLAVSDRENGASVGIDPTEDVTLTSSDGSVSIAADADERTVDFTGAGGGGPGPLEAYLREHALRRTACTFADLRDQFEQSPTEAASTADDIARAARDELGADAPAYEDPDEFVGFVEENLQRQMGVLLNQLPAFVGGREDYERGVGRLDTAIGNGDPLEVAIAIHRICEAVDCLSGYCVRFDGFNATTPIEVEERPPGTPVTSPLTLREVVIDPKLDPNPGNWDDVPVFVPTEDERVALGFPRRGLRIVVPTTSFAAVTVREADDGALLRAFDDQNNLIQEVDGDTSDGSSVTLNVESDRINHLDLTCEAREAQLMAVCVR